MKLNFFTANFPYKNSEPIIDNEFPFLLEEFDEVKIFPHDFNSINENIERAKEAEVYVLKDYTKSKLNLQYFSLIIRFFITEFLNSKNKPFYFKKSRLWLSLLKAAALKAKHIEGNDLLLKDAVNYSYWMNDWALVLTFLKKRKKINNFVFRCGGFDIWDERHEGNYLPFRELIYKYADGVFPNSKLAETYMKEKTKFKHKIIGTYLGTTDFGVSTYKEHEKLTIVSCSNVISIKRVELIIEILSLLKRPVKWVHFGDGVEMSKIKKLAEEKLSHQEVELNGRVQNSKVYEYYTLNQVDLFITTSSTEGLPVSIQEAISFGIPVIATDVGAMDEVINKDTGILIEKDFDIEKVADIIDSWLINKDIKEYRNGVRKYWLENFHAHKVYPEFTTIIKTIANKK